jgi:hypothetical protein
LPLTTGTYRIPFPFRYTGNKGVKNTFVQIPAGLDQVS